MTSTTPKATTIGRAPLLPDDPLKQTVGATPPRAVLAVAVGLGGIALVGLLDYVSGFILSFSLFYLAPIWAAVRLGGRRLSIGIALIAAIVWLVVDKASGHSYVTWYVPVWNTSVRLGIFLTVALLFSSLQESLRKERVLSRRDPLTGLRNRRAFFERLEAEHERARRYDRPWSLAYIDLDNFKTMNDRFGHAAGDAVLRYVADALQSRLRRTDTVARLGGDEFAVLMPETDAAAAASTLEQLLSDLTEFMTANGWPVGLSIGAVTVLKPPSTVQLVVNRADNLMYQVKQQGKGHVLVEVLAEEVAPTSPQP